MASREADLKVKHANIVVDRISAALRENKPAFYYPLLSRKRVAQVIKGGSLGHGTTVPGDFDVDLVLQSQDITPEEMLDTHGVAKLLMDELKLFIATRFRVEVKATVAQFLLLLEFPIRVNEFGVEIEVQVDLVVAPYWSDIYEAADHVSRLMSIHADAWADLRTLFSPVFAEWQKKFVKDQPNRVKELIKRAKKWMKQTWPPNVKNDGRPKSYLIEILMVEACRRWCENQPGFNTLDDHMSDTEFRRVQSIFSDMVINHRRLRLLQSPWFRFHEGAGRGRYTFDIRPGHPYVLDPADPFKDLYETGVKPYDSGNPGQVDNWGAFVKNIGSLDLTRDLFQ